MFRYGLKHLRSKKLRYLLTFAGVATLLILINILNMANVGLRKQFSSYLRNTNFDLIITPPNTFELNSNSFIDPHLGNEIAKIEGVRKVSPGLAVFSDVTIGKQRVNMFIVGFKPGELTSPVSTEIYRRKKLKGKIIVDSSLKFFTPFKVGTNVKIKDKVYEIGAVTSGYMLYTSPAIFLEFKEMRKLIDADKLTNYLLVKTEQSKVKKVLDAISKNYKKKVRVTTKNQNLNEYTKAMSFYSMVLNLISVVIGLIGVLLIALIVLISVVEQERELGIIKALGARHRTLVSFVFTNVITIAFFSSTIACLGSWLFSKILSSFITFDLLLTGRLIAYTFIIAFVLSVLGGLFGIRKVLKADPLVCVSVVEQ